MTVITDDKAKENVAANVNRLLERRGLTRADLARLTGENEMMISRICRGLIMPSVGVLARIAEALRTSIDHLIDEPPARAPLGNSRHVNRAS